MVVLLQPFQLRLDVLVLFMLFTGAAAATW